MLAQNLAGAKEAYLFGSVALGVDEWDSDIDLLVVFADERALRSWQRGLPALQDAVLATFGNHLQAVAYARRALARAGAKRLLAKARENGVALRAPR